MVLRSTAEIPKIENNPSNSNNYKKIILLSPMKKQLELLPFLRQSQFSTCIFYDSKPSVIDDLYEYHQHLEANNSIFDNKI